MKNTALPCSGQPCGAFDITDIVPGSQNQTILDTASWMGSSARGWSYTSDPTLSSSPSPEQPGFLLVMSSDTFFS